MRDLAKDDWFEVNGSRQCSYLSRKVCQSSCVFVNIHSYHPESNKVVGVLAKTSPDLVLS